MFGSGPDRVDPEWSTKVMLIFTTILVLMAGVCIAAFLS